ncbi:PKD domain-containing protein [Zeaxanthinibacter enoshimensis]|uniref:PKD domain-containing protein n=1 Tax=Zeaxanthinibacter enoshimensis TaxID=392009 RepID=A0A4R6TQ62_9FLAO|nr:PKD domain-containing protein [Zeaxanthinibacter enoshimensis]TDQ32417.1 PKD domain-containing protein [Zeaxanthinibacter enoshimensis]
MKSILNKLNLSAITPGLIIMVLLTACDFEYDLPEEGSFEDKTPPSANFTYSQGEGDNWMVYSFANQSTSATDFEWDFGDGNSSTELDAQNTYPGEGTYTVTLTASDKLGVTNVSSQVVEVVEPEVPLARIPVILEADFEDNSLPDGTGDGRDSWRNDFGGVIQITSSPVQSGAQAAKFPSAGDRVAYQDGLEVTPNTEYVLTYYYTLKTNNPGSITLTVLGGTITDLAEVAGATLASFEGTDQDSASTYVKVDLPFNSGANETISILITNQGEEARLDNITIDLGV